MHFETTYAVQGGLGALRNLDPAIVLRFSMNVHFDSATFGYEHQNTRRSRGSLVGLP